MWCVVDFNVYCKLMLSKIRLVNILFAQPSTYDNRAIGGQVKIKVLLSLIDVNIGFSSLALVYVTF